MSDSTATATPDAELGALLAISGGRPIIQIVLDPDDDRTSIRSAGLAAESVAHILLRLGRALTAEG